MKFFRRQIAISDANDSALVMHSLGGNRDAFCEIVTRYQNLLCSIAYASVGDIKYSEDLAQEAFVEAWKKLDTLSDPNKLKSWLCGILRFKVSHHRRKEVNQPVRSADEIEQHGSLESTELNTESAAIDEQQQALLWKALDDLEETYREPLVLFYREQQSIQRVAEELELSEDNVKQRLSRGRKLLKQAMSTFVEEALKKSKPGVAFTAGVLSAISSVSPPAKAAAIGAGVMKSSSAINFAAFWGLLAAFSGLISSYFGLRASLDQSRTQRERWLAIKSASFFISVSAFFTLGIFSLIWLAEAQSNLSFFAAIASQVLVFLFIIIHVFLVPKMLTMTRDLRAQERLFEPEAFTKPQHQEGSSSRELISRIRILGVPLYHFQLGTPEHSDGPAYGWIAGGGFAKGLLFAWGGIAIAPISVGIIAYGGFAIGAVGIGLFGTGAVAVGVVAFGASAVAYKAYSSLTSLGWESAFSNGFSFAFEGAIGPIAYAEHVNNEQAAELINLTMFGNVYQWILGAIALLVIVPSVLHARNVRRRMR